VRLDFHCVLPLSLDAFPNATGKASGGTEFFEIPRGCSRNFQTWSDKAGKAVSAPLAPLTDPTFPELNSPPFGGETFQTNLIMPEPCPFLSRSLPACSIIRPTETEGVATVGSEVLDDHGLFIGQLNAFFELLQDLAADADAAKRHG
jgi:hypothetical protein